MLFSSGLMSEPDDALPLKWIASHNSEANSADSSHASKAPRTKSEYSQRVHPIPLHRARLSLPQNFRKAGSSFSHSRTSFLKRSYPKPTCAASQNIVRQIPPCEGSPDQRAADKRGTDRFQKGRVPQLKKLKRTGDPQNPGRDPKRGSTRPHQSRR